MTTSTAADPPTTPGRRPTTAVDVNRRPRLRQTVGDALVLVGRSLRHTVRNVDGLLMSAILPVVMLLLFVYVFGGAIDVGTDDINYVVPGIILLTASFGSAITATTVTADMTEGIIHRFRSMPIHSAVAVLGHVVASMVRNLFVTPLVLGVAIALGFPVPASCGGSGWSGPCRCARRDLGVGHLRAARPVRATGSSHGRPRAGAGVDPTQPAASPSPLSSCHTSRVRSCRRRRCRRCSMALPNTSR